MNFAKNSDWKILAIFKLDWLCRVVKSLCAGCKNGIITIDYTLSQLAGSKVGDGVIPYLEAIKDLFVSTENIYEYL